MGTVELPAVGTLMREAGRDRVGVVMAVQFGFVYLRPLGGGQEWTARPDELVPADRADELRARVSEMNAASRERGYGR